MPRRARRSRGRSRGNNGNSRQGPSRFPTRSLTRTFRQSLTVQLDNTAGSGLQQYAYYSKYYRPTPHEAFGFDDAATTFEFWRLKRFRCRVQPGYNDYNQSYNTINQDVIAAMQIWTCSDPSMNETISGVSIKSYNNAKVHTLSLNGIKTIVDTACRINQLGTVPLSILPSSAWLCTLQNMDTNYYSGFQFFAQMNGVTGANYRPTLQLIFEYVVEFKQPGYQNRPNSFEAGIIGSTLTTYPDSSAPTVERVYVVVAYTMNSSGNLYRLERQDGEPGSLEYTMQEFYQVYVSQNSGKYFNARSIIWDGPIPRRPVEEGDFTFE